MVTSGRRREGRSGKDSQKGIYITIDNRALDSRVFDDWNGIKYLTGNLSHWIRDYFKNGQSKCLMFDSKSRSLRPKRSMVGCLRLH